MHFLFSRVSPYHAHWRPLLALATSVLLAEAGSMSGVQDAYPRWQVVGSVSMPRFLSTDVAGGGVNSSLSTTNVLWYKGGGTQWS